MNSKRISVFDKYGPQKIVKRKLRSNRMDTKRSEDSVSLSSKITINKNTSNTLSNLKKQKYRILFDSPQNNTEKLLEPDYCNWNLEDIENPEFPSIEEVPISEEKKSDELTEFDSSLNGDLDVVYQGFLNRYDSNGNKLYKTQ